MLPDSRLPSKGPGRASDGNFVLNEFAVTAAPKADPKQAKPVKLEKALADFSQDDFDVAKAIDGSANDQGKGWAVSPATGTTHWATFETAQPIGGAGGTVLTFKMSHQFQNVWTLGRFRLSVDPGRQAGRPRACRRTSGPSWPSPPELRTEAQKNALLAYFRAMDPELRAKYAAVMRARRRCRSIPKLQELRDQVEYAKKPIPIDPSLVALRRDVEISIEQATARRLTAAQDIAWALINSPAFLFNH